MDFADVLIGLGTGQNPALLREDAYNAGRLHSAQTESAIQQARERRANAMLDERTLAERERMRDMAAASGEDPSIVDVMLAGYNPDQYMSGRATGQEMGFRDVIAGEGERDAQLRAMEAIQGKPIERYYQPATGMMAQQMDPEAAPVVTPVGAAGIKADEALAADRLTGAAAGGSGGPGALRSSSGITFERQADGTWKPIVSGEELAELLRQNAGGRAVGGAQGERASVLQSGLLNFQDMASNAEKLRTHAGRTTIYGGSANLNPITTRLGQDAAGAEALRKQLGSQGFLVAIQAMRGLGQLSNAEGLKVESALQRLTDTILPDDEFDAAYNDFIQKLQRLEEVAIMEAGVDPMTVQRSVFPALVQTPGASPASVAAPGAAAKPMPPENELADAAARRGVTVEELKARLRARGYQ